MGAAILGGPYFIEWGSFQDQQRPSFKCRQVALYQNRIAILY